MRRSRVQAGLDDRRVARRLVVLFLFLFLFLSSSSIDGTTGPADQPSGNAPVTATSFSMDGWRLSLTSPVPATGCTDTRTRPTARFGPSLTVSSNVSAEPTVGARNVACAACSSSSSTGAPSVWVHENVSGSCSGSRLREPSRVTRAPAFTDWSVPAVTIGGRFPCAQPTPSTPVAHASERVVRRARAWIADISMAFDGDSGGGPGKATAENRDEKNMSVC